MHETNSTNQPSLLKHKQSRLITPSFKSTFLSENNNNDFQFSICNDPLYLYFPFNSIYLTIAACALLYIDNRWHISDVYVQ